MLFVIVPPTMRHELDDYTVTANYSITMSCEATGLPPPVVTWSRGGVPLELSTNDSNTDGTQLFPNGVLRIGRAHINDSGTYECVATNVAGSVTRHVRLRVQGDILHLLI